VQETYKNSRTHAQHKRPSFKLTGGKEEIPDLRDKRRKRRRGRRRENEETRVVKETTDKENGEGFKAFRRTRVGTRKPLADQRGRMWRRSVEGHFTAPAAPQNTPDLLAKSWGKGRNGKEGEGLARRAMVGERYFGNKKEGMATELGGHKPGGG